MEEQMAYLFAFALVTTLTPAIEATAVVTIAILILPNWKYGKNDIYIDIARAILGG